MQEDSLPTELSGKPIAVHGLSLVVASGGDSSLWCAGFSQWLLLMRGMGSRAHGLQQLCCAGLVAPRHVASFWIRDQTCVLCFRRRILNHWTTREVQYIYLSIIYLFSLFFFLVMQRGLQDLSCLTRNEIHVP